MPWGFFSSSSPTGNDDEGDPKRGPAKNTTPTHTTWRNRLFGSPPPPPAPPNNADSWFDSARESARDHLAVPHNWIAPAAAAVLSMSLLAFYQSYLRRIPAVDHIRPGFYRRRSLFGKVTSVGDGDGFHLFHTPGGRLAGWGWLRRVPKDKKKLKGKTVSCAPPSSYKPNPPTTTTTTLTSIFATQLSIRLAGVDAPEGAHFGRPAQPFAAEALSFLESYLHNARVRTFLHRRDQYERVVATAYVRKWPWFFLRRDVGLELLRRGLAVTYEGKTGAEFGGKGVEERYRAAEALARKKGKGMWEGEMKREEVLETPGEFKKRMKALEGGEGIVKEEGKEVKV